MGDDMKTRLALVALGLSCLVACGSGSGSTTARHGAEKPSDPAAPPGAAQPGTPGAPQPGGPTPGTAPPPAGPAITGDVSFRVANFTAGTADVCIKGDDGVWQGPLFGKLAGGPLAAQAVSERVKTKNSHFVARIVDADCTKARGADVTVPLLGGTWSATFVLGDTAAGPKLVPLVDTPTGSATYSFIRLVNTGGWAMDTDFGIIDGDGNFAGLAIDVPALGLAKSGSIDAQGYSFLDPLDGNTSVVLQGTTSGNPILQLDGLTTDANVIYSMYTLGTADAPTVLFCNDDAAPTNHVASCQILPQP
jgi:hypothetical protein